MSARIARVSMVLAWLGTVVVVSTHQLKAAQPPKPAVASESGTPLGLGPGKDELTPEVQSHVARADELFRHGRYGAARVESRKAVEMARTQGHLPTFSLRLTANIQYFEKSYRSVAATLDELAAEAATFGDLAAEARALVDAAWMYGKLGWRRQVDARVERVKRLLGSPYMPPTVREQILATRLQGLVELTAR